MNAPATNPPTTGRRMGFQRGAASSPPAATSPAGASPAATVDATGDASGAEDPASSEQSSTLEHMTNIDWDKAASHSSAGLARGRINQAKITSKGTGVWLGVNHAKDNTLAGINFMIWREEKGTLDPKTGKPIRTADATGRKAFAKFCAFFELNPGEVMSKLAEIAENKAPASENPLVGIEGMFAFKDGKDANAMMSATLDEQATLQMRTAADDDAG